MRLRDIGVTTKLRLGFVVAFVLIAAVGAVSLLQVRTHNNLATVLAESTLPEIIRIDDIDRQLSEYRGLAQRRVETNDFRQLARIDEQLDLTVAGIDANLDAYGVVADAAEEQAALVALRAQWMALQARLAEVLEAGESGRFSESYTLFDDVFLAGVDETRATVEKLLMFARAEVTGAADQAHGLYGLSLGLLIAVVLFSAAGLCAAMVWLSGSVSEPIRRISLDMRRLIAGDETVIIAGDGNRGDEIGTLLAAAASFRDSLIRQRRLTRDAERQRERFAAAIGNLPIGLAMFGADQRLLVCNDRYRRLYGLTPELSQPGTPFDAIVERRVRGGRMAIGEDGGAFRRKMQAMVRQREPFTDVFRLGTGQMIHMAFQPLDDGGWITVHEDITTRHDAERRIRSLAQEANIERQRLAAAMSNLPIGVVMFDSEERIITSNVSYSRTYGLPPGFVVPGMPLEAIVRYRAEVGSLGGETPDHYLENTRSLVRANAPYKGIMRIRDSRVISINHVPLAGGGWIATHEDITDRTEAEARIAHMARHDLLTDLPNRDLFRQRLEEELRRASRDRPAAVLSLDLDHFKRVNQGLGQALGDSLLKTVADRLRGCVREGDTVARFGGDEFAIIQIDAEQPRGARTLAQRIVEVLGEPFVIEGRQATIGVSIGIALAPTDGDTSDGLMKNVDLALIRAKGDGRGAYRFFERETDLRMQAHRALDIDLQRAIEEEQFTVVYQPQVNVTTGRIAGFEALLRWHHPKRGQVPPADFIPVAEETGMIVPLGEKVLKWACRDAARWPSDVRVLVNLSPIQFRSARLTQAVVDALAGAHLLPSRLELEITESALLEESETTLSALHHFRELGVQIGMDDFGTGHSSLGYLQGFPSIASRSTAASSRGSTRTRARSPSCAR